VPDPAPSPADRAAELASLRREIELRIVCQNAILLLLWIAFAVAAIWIAVAPVGPLLPVAYALVAAIGAVMWAHHGARTVQIRTYLLTVGEPAGSGWERWLGSHRFASRLGSRWFVSTKGVFLGTQVLAALWAAVGPVAPDWRAALAIVLITAATAWSLREARLHATV